MFSVQCKNITAYFCVLSDVPVMFGFSAHWSPPGSGGDGREWELGKCAMFCWRLWTEGLKEQLCGESQHSVLYCTSPVIIEVIIELVFWPLKPSVLSSHRAQCVVLLSFAGHKINAFFCLLKVSSLNHPQCINQTVMLPFCSTGSQTMISVSWTVQPILWSIVHCDFVKITMTVNLAEKMTKTKQWLIAWTLFDSFEREIYTSYLVVIRCWSTFTCRDGFIRARNKLKTQS